HVRLPMSAMTLALVARQLERARTRPRLTIRPATTATPAPRPTRARPASALARTPSYAPPLTSVTRWEPATPRRVPAPIRPLTVHPATTATPARLRIRAATAPAWVARRRTATTAISAPTIAAILLRDASTPTTPLPVTTATYAPAATRVPMGCAIPGRRLRVAATQTPTATTATRPQSRPATRRAACAILGRR